jgi:hypothetical protein
MTKTEQNRIEAGALRLKELQVRSNAEISE